MSEKTPINSQAERRPAERVAAPDTQAKARRLSPTYALAWLHLIPESFFPIRSRNDMAAKVSAGLLGSRPPDTQRTGHGLPVAAQESRKKSGAN